MEAAGVDVVVSARPEDCAYLTARRAFIYRALIEGRMSEVVVLSRSGRMVLVTMDAYVAFYESVGVHAAPISRLQDVIAEAAVGAAAVAVPADCPCALRDVAERAAPRRVSSVDPLADARLCKSEGELATMRAASRLAGAGIAAMLDACRPGTTEAQVAARGEATMRAAGAESFCFSTIVASGPELGLMREVTTTRRLEEGDWVMVDGGCAVDGYNAEFARSIQVGGPDERYSEAYRAVYAAQQAAIAQIRAGVPAAAVDAAARRVIGDRGLGEHCHQHITGHGIGTGVWEAPALAPDATNPLPTGAVMSVEPGVYIPGVGGIRIEDLVLVTDLGAEVLTDAPLLDSLVAEPVQVH